jgi:hypothetical protein
MRDESPREPPWSIHGRLGTLDCDVLQGRVDVARPQLGLHQIRLHDRALTGSICAVERKDSSDSLTVAWPVDLTDAYVRGHDLVACYQPADDWPFAPQIYWQAEPQQHNHEVLGGLSLLVSVSTHLLDTRPCINVVSHLDADDVLYFNSSTNGGIHERYLTKRSESVLSARAGASCLLRRLCGGNVSYAEIMPASDFCQLCVERDDNGRSLARWELFAEFLEKGVIRRTRMQTLFVPRADDMQLANAWCQMISSRPLPLTT